MKSPTLEIQCVEGIFQMQYPICAVNLNIKVKLNMTQTLKTLNN